MSPTGTPPEIGNRVSQPYSNVRLTPTATSPRLHIDKPRRGSTLLIKQLEEWGPDHNIYGINAIDKQLKQEEEEAKKTKTKTKTNRR